MAKTAIKSAYNEIGGIRSTLRKYAKMSWNPDFLFYRLRWNWAPKLKYVTNFPTHLDIETTNVCNYRCVMCPHGYPDRKKFNFVKHPGFMDFGLFKKIVDECARRGLKAIKFNWRGEPLLHPKLADMIRYAKQAGLIDVMFNTNGYFMDQAKAREIIAARPDRIIFSLDGATKSTYEKVRIGGDFNKVVKNINRTINIKKELGLKVPLIGIQMVRMQDTEDDVEKFISMWKGKADYLAVNYYSNRGEQNNRQSTNVGLVATGRRPCPYIWQRMMIACDGKILMCCGDWLEKTPLGTFPQTSIRQAWKGAQLQHYRKLHKQRKLDMISACKDCCVKSTYVWEKAPPEKIAVLAEKYKQFQPNKSILAGK